MQRRHPDEYEMGKWRCHVGPDDRWLWVGGEHGRPPVTGLAANPRAAVSLSKTLNPIVADGQVALRMLAAVISM